MNLNPTNAPVQGHDGAGRSGLVDATKLFALVLAITFVGVGIVGFFITGFDDFAGHSDEYLLAFEINPLHNLVHLALGVVGLALWRTTKGALAYGYIVLIGYFGAFLYGLVAIDKSWDILSINLADNWLHLGLALVGAVLVGLGHAARADTAPRDRRTWLRSPDRHPGHGAPA
jgi:hypothetical protein